MDHAIQLAALKPAKEISGPHKIRELALAKVLPLAVRAEDIIDDDIAAPSLIEAGDDIGPDEPGPAGNQQHRDPNSGLPRRKSFARLTPGAQLDEKHAVNASGSSTKEPQTWLAVLRRPADLRACRAKEY